MTTAVFVRVNSPHVVADDVDGEVIVINLENGAYYSFREAAAAIWQQLLRAESSLDDIIDGVRTRYEGSRDTMSASIAAFLKSIENEGLVVLTQRVADGPLTPCGVAVDANPFTLAPFVVPVYEKYTDMQAFLLVDPIHDVDITDWPTARKREPS